MELSELAERVLFGDSLEDKLVNDDVLEDGSPGRAISTPDQPGRPASLSLDAWHQRERVQFGEIRRFHSDKEHGLVLHFFANHELLALELMALALLKFPQAPAAFRRGVAGTLRDEQAHLKLYVDRMREVGVEFGEIPVSDFFWRAISTMETPMDFVTSLCLTLEQANLDYAPHYQQVYEELGDERTAAIMSRVYRDEINHVRHGLNWFERWREAGETQWSAYESALRKPLTPGRAKGIGFNKRGREQAGLSAAFISELQVFSHSRGRCPDVYWFNPACDSHVGWTGRTFTPPTAARDLAADFATLPMFLCAREDVVLVPERPPTRFLKRLHSAGFDIPEFVSCANAEDLNRSQLSERKLHGLRPWGWGPDSARMLAPLASNVVDREERMLRPEWHRRLRPLYSKSWSAELLPRLLVEVDEGEGWLCHESVVGKSCGSLGEVAEQTRILMSGRGEKEVVVKGAFGTAGQGQVHLRNTGPTGSSSFDERKQAWIERLLREHGSVVVEPWLNRIVDLSAQYEIGHSGEVRFLGITRFLTDRRGQYLGSFVQQKLSGLDEQTRRFLYGDGQDGRRLNRLYEHLGSLLAEAAKQVDYTGPIGVDAVVYRSADELKLKPIVEVNPRFTMGRVALELAPRVNAARTALWMIVRTADLEQSEAENALEMTADGQISRGALFTTDPEAARTFASVLVVAESLEQCEGILSRIKIVGAQSKGGG